MRSHYVYVCRDSLHIKISSQPNVPLPDCAPGEWGPAKAVKLAGLLPLSHFLPVINAAPEANVRLGESKPLTLNMEFEMTRPLLDFIVRLHKNGERYDDEVRKKNIF